MKLSSLFKILFLLVIPSAALVVGAPYWQDLVSGGADWMGPFSQAERIRNIGWTGLWLGAAFSLVWGVGYLLSPQRAQTRGRRPMPALLRDLIRYGIFVFCAALILRHFWGDTVAPIFGALGIGGVVLGFALQETLSNFFAGLALLLEQPFQQGDWVRIGDRPEGEVEHITWRATKLRTRDNDYQILPNSMVAKEVILNFKQPNEVHAIRLAIGTSYNDPPDKVKRVVLQVVASVAEILKTPAPIVYLKSYADFSINYECKCFIEDYSRRPVIEDDAMHRLWYAFRREGIEIPFPIQTVYEHRVPYTIDEEKQKGVDIAKILSTIPIFQSLGPEQIAQLAVSSRSLDFGRGEVVVRQGDGGDAMFAIVGGEAKVLIRLEDGTEKSVATLGPGDVFGEMSLLTGEPRTATVAAEGALVVVSVSKSALLPILTAHPELSEKMAETVALRKQGLTRAQGEGTLDAAKRAEVKGAAQSLLGRIRSYFKL